MNRLRLALQWLLSAIAIPLGFNHKLGQCCDRCGRFAAWKGFWADNDVWEAVAGNVNGCRHGCFCRDCFTLIARDKGIRLDWKPSIV